MDKRRLWMSALIEEGLRLGVLAPADLLEHVTPSVLATDLPPSVVASLIQTGLTGGNFSPEVVISTLGVPALAEHVPLPVLWASVDQAAGQIIAEHPLSSTQVHGLTLPGLDEEPDIEVVEG